MVIRLIIAGFAVGVVALAPRSRWSALAALAAGAVSVLLSGGWVARDTLVSVGPMLLFLTAALGLAALAERAGLAERAAARLAGAGGPRRVYALVCTCSALLTFVVSLDGAVVLMVPLVRALSRRTGIPAAPLLAGAVGVANAASLAVPEGNPTNLVVMSRLGLSPGQFVGHLFLPGLAAALVCALVPVRKLRDPGAPAAEGRASFVVPWRIGAQMTGLLAALDGIAPAVSLHGGGLVALLAVAGGTAAAAALANNLPVSASVAALATAGPGAYAALIGLSVGALATAHGSVATLIARDLSGDRRPWTRVWAPASAAAVLLATVLLWALSS
jgi:Na+/H+ antiporter NhaD/arsenite permease-like protein